ncbi:MAG: SWIM zinc finger family protein [Catenulispora sp.]
MGSRGAFAESWWGRAWIDALENTSMDAGRLTRGRTYARRGAVEQITVTPGSAKAKVQGSRPRPYSSSVGVKQLSDKDWERFLDTVAARAAHIAALLDRDMPPGLVEDARAAGVRLLPGVGDLEPDCSCPDWGWPCKHASALCYQIARLLDVDPFVLLLLRGRGEQELMEELRTRNARAAAAASDAVVPTPSAAPPSGVSAMSVLGSVPDHDSQLGAIVGFEIGAAPDRPELPPVLASSAKNGAIDHDGLEMVAADAAYRAHALVTEYQGSASPAAVPLLPRHSIWQDAVRAVATRTADAALFTRIADLYDLEDEQLAMAVRAWQQGGPAGLEVLEHPWSPTAADKARARTALEEYADDAEPPPLRLWHNRWTAEAEGVQIRLGTDGRWYPYRRDGGGRWWPDGPAERDAAAALAGLLGEVAGG